MTTGVVLLPAKDIMQELLDHDWYAEAREIAIEAARKFQPSYFVEPFEPHPWAIAAVIEGMGRIT